MATQVTAVPKGYHTVTPYLVQRDAAKAIEFYKKAFGAEQVVSMPGPGGKGVMHAELKIGDSMVMLGDEMPAMGTKSPAGYGGSPVTFYVYLDKVDAAWKQAVDAGAKVIRPLTEMFWGDRTGQLEDPFGHRWSLAQHVKDVTPEEIKKGQEEFYKKQMQPV